MKRAILMVVVLILMAAFVVCTDATAQQNGGGATIYVFREKDAVVGSALRVYCDGQELARLGKQQYFIAKIPAGDHSIRSTSKKVVLELNLKPGDLHYIRIALSGGLIRAVWEVVDVVPSQAEKAIQGLQYAAVDNIKDRKLVLPRPPSLEGEQGPDRQEPVR